MDITLVLTHDCNLGCTYCYAGRKFRKTMPFETVDASLDLVFKNTNPDQKVQVAYFGGEPTLEWGKLIYSAKRARKMAEDQGKTLLQSVTTNGTLLTAEKVHTLSELDVYIALSIDGNQKAHEVNRPSMGGKSTWAEVSRALDLLVSEGKAFETISVVTPDSVSFFGESVEELFLRGTPRISINPCYEAIWTDKHFSNWEQGLVHVAQIVASWLRVGRTVSFSPFDSKIIGQIKGGFSCADKCSLGETSITVSPNGNLYPCERLVGEDEDLQHTIGHILTGIDQQKVLQTRSKMPEYHAKNLECKECVEQSRCGAYCACANYAETGDIGIAGGVQCWYERTTMQIGDALAKAMITENNEPFLKWFFPNGYNHSYDDILEDGKRSVKKPVKKKRTLPLVD